MIAHQIGTVEMVTSAAPDYLEEWGEPKTRNGLVNHSGVNFLSGQSNRPLSWYFRSKGADQPYTCRGTIIVNESNAYVHCVVAGFGIIQAPGSTVDASLASGELVEVLQPYRPTRRKVSVLYPSRTHLAPQVHVFADWLRQHFPAFHPAWFKAQ